MLRLLLLFWLLSFQSLELRAATFPIFRRSVDLTADLCPLQWQQFNVPMAGVDFLSENEALIYTVCHVGAAFSVHDKFQPSDPYHLKAVILDTKTGKVSQHFDWPTHGHDSGLHVTHAGNLLLHRDNVIELLTPDGKILNRVRVQRTSDTDAIYVAVSPSTDIVAVSTIPNLGMSAPSLALVLDSRNLQVLYDWKDNADGANIAATSNMALRTTLGGMHLVGRKAGETAWTTILSEEKQTIGRPVFVNDSEFAVTAKESLLVLDLTGKTVASFPALHKAIKTTVSRDGLVMAQAWAWTGNDNYSGPPIDYQASGLDLYRVPSPLPTGWAQFGPLAYGFDVALSPTGAKFAVVSKLQVWIFEMAAR